jgi:hypothetical protein
MKFPISDSPLFLSVPSLARRCRLSSHTRLKPFVNRRCAAPLWSLGPKDHIRPTSIKSPTGNLARCFQPLVTGTHSTQASCYEPALTMRSHAQLFMAPCRAPRNERRVRVGTFHDTLILSYSFVPHLSPYESPLVFIPSPAYIIPSLSTVDA